jgi:hypothetical protein
VALRVMGTGEDLIRRLSVRLPLEI